MPPPAAGNHNIQTSGGQFLSLAAAGGAVSLEAVAVGNNQVWDFQLVGANYTIRNVGQNTFLQAGLVANAPVAGGAAMNWTLVAVGDNFSIRPAANNNYRWGFNAAAVNLLNVNNDLAIEGVHQFQIQ